MYKGAYSRESYSVHRSMKAIMYHYVRPDTIELLYFRHLHIDDFSKQLEIFGNDCGFVSK